jgi:maltooligosyltrehalose synthase
VPAAWPIAKFLFKLVAPSIPDIVSTVVTLKNQQAEPQTREEPLQARIAEMEQRLTQQLELIETLTQQVKALQTILWRTLVIGLVALGLALTGLALIFYA